MLRNPFLNIWSKTALPTDIANGFPPNVEPCVPAIIPDAVGAVAGVAYSLTQAPRSLDENPAAVSQSAGSISSTRYFGVGSTAMPSSDSVFGPSHSGWVGVQTYTDNHGNFRVKTEVLVAMSGIQTGNETFPNYKA